MTRSLNSNAQGHSFFYCPPSFYFIQSFYLFWSCTSLLEIFLYCSNPQIFSLSSSPSNFRPISLLCIISKLLEKHDHTIFLDFVTPTISSPHFNLASFLIALPPLFYSTHSILSLLESSSSVCSAFLDLKKAFNSVPHSLSSNQSSSISYLPFVSLELAPLIPLKLLPICHS